MNLLLDANLSWRLVKELSNCFDTVQHIDAIEISHPATDIQIWNAALQMNSIIVTNDDDFLNLLLQKGFPPKIILLRTGNQRNDFIKEILIKHRDDITQLNNSQEYGLLEIFG